MKSLLLLAGGAAIFVGRVLFKRRPRTDSEPNSTPPQSLSIPAQPIRHLPHRYAPRIQAIRNNNSPIYNSTHCHPQPSLPNGNSAELRLHWGRTVYFYTSDLPTSVIFKKFISNGECYENLHDLEDDEKSQGCDEDEHRKFEDLETSEFPVEQEAVEVEEIIQSSVSTEDNYSSDDNEMNHLCELFENAVRDSRLHAFIKDLFTDVLHNMVVSSLDNKLFDLDFAKSKLGYQRTLRKKRIIEIYVGKHKLAEAAGTEQPFCSIKATLNSMIGHASERDDRIIKKFVKLIEFCETNQQLKHTMIQVLF